MRLFDRKFGAEFLAGVPREPGTYRLYDASGALLYVGKARDLRRRLAQYRTAGRTKKDRKRRALVRSAERIEWQACGSELEASLIEIGLIQTLRPSRNVVNAFPFLYPFIGLRVAGGETTFCLTTSPAAFAAFELHGAFRSRDVTGEAFFALMRLLRFVGHPTARRRRDRRSLPRHSYLRTFRRLPRDWSELWKGLFRGASRAALEQLALRLLELDGACARSAAIHADLRAVERFFVDEASPLAEAIMATGYVGYPVAQEERDALFLRYRDLRSGVTGGRSGATDLILVPHSIPVSERVEETGRASQPVGGEQRADDGCRADDGDHEEEAVEHDHGDKQPKPPAGDAGPHALRPPFIHRHRAARVIADTAGDVDLPAIGPTDYMPARVASLSTAPA